MALNVNIGCVANLFSRQMHFEKAGDIEHGHTHSFDHLTLLANGKLKIIVDGKESIFVAPQMIYIKAEKMHELTALEDNTVAYCIHALRIGEDVDDIVDPSMVPEGVDMGTISDTTLGNDVNIGMKYNNLSCDEIISNEYDTKTKQLYTHP
jgi:hypothetical protein